MTDMADGHILDQMNERSREVFRRVVEGYLATGDPVGSRSLTRDFSEKVSAATIRNVMQDLEYLGLLDSPHVSAGPGSHAKRAAHVRGRSCSKCRMSKIADRRMIDATVGSNSQDVAGVLDRIGSALSGVTRGASLVLTPKHEAPIKHMEFVSLGRDRALVVLVFSDGHVENRIFTPPPGQTPSSMREAANFLNALVEGRTMSDVQHLIATEIARAGRRSTRCRRPWSKAGSPSGKARPRATATSA